MKTLQNKSKKTLRPAKKTKKVIQDETITKIVISKKLKYRYPPECTDYFDRKEFRRQVRDRIRKLEARVNQLRGDAKKRSEKTLRRYRIKVLANPNERI